MKIDLTEARVQVSLFISLIKNINSDIAKILFFNYKQFSTVENNKKLYRNENSHICGKSHITIK